MKLDYGNIKKENRNRELDKRTIKGITLIALVITIIVLLILSGVSIAMLTGENGILNQANKAKVETENANEIEKIQMEVLGSYNNSGELDINKLKENLRKNIGIEVSENEFPISITTKQGNIKISQSGEITNIGEYASNGLMLYYDGRNNTANGHSNDTNIWKDLSGNSHDGQLKNGCVWEEDGLKFDGIDDWVKIGEMNYDNITLEVVALNYTLKDSGTQYICNYQSGGYGLTYNIGGKNYNNGFQVCVNSNYVNVNDDKSKMIANKKYSLSGSYNGKEMIFSQNGNKNILSVEGKIIKTSINTVLAIGVNPIGLEDLNDGGNLNRKNIFSKGI